MRMPAALSVATAGAAAVAFGALAIGAAMAVPDRPAPAQVEDYLEDLEATPPPAASAAILREATGDTIPAATPPTVASTDDGSTGTADDHGGPGSSDDTPEIPVDDSGPGSVDAPARRRQHRRRARTLGHRLGRTSGAPLRRSDRLISR